MLHGLVVFAELALTAIHVVWRLDHHRIHYNNVFIVPLNLVQPFETIKKVF
jgi:hypothetical protein